MGHKHNSIKKFSKDTLTPVEMDCGETLEFVLEDGTIWRMELVKTSAQIFRTTLKELRVEEEGARTDYTFTCDILVNGTPFTLEREVSTQKSFYEPWEADGVCIWFDAVDDIFDFLTETHGECRPHKQARFALHESSRSICPVPLHPWYPLPEEGIGIDLCYRGEDCWLGAYNGASAHGGLDLNHEPGTPLWAPVDFDDQFYFNTVEQGHGNNRWRGIFTWDNGAEWILQAHHMTELTVPEHTPLAKGVQFAQGAGVCSGAVDHSHFVFKVRENNETVLLDPWILFRQMYKDAQ